LTDSWTPDSTWPDVAEPELPMQVSPPFLVKTWANSIKRSDLNAMLVAFFTAKECKLVSKQNKRLIRYKFCCLKLFLI